MPLYCRISGTSHDAEPGAMGARAQGREGMQQEGNYKMEIDDGARGDSAGGGGRFWSKDSTRWALGQLDVWATVRKCRKIGATQVPTMDAIFEVEGPNEVPFRLTEGGVLQADWKVFRWDRTEKVLSPEVSIFLSVEGILRRNHRVRVYISCLMAYFPRTGPYGPGICAGAKAEPLLRGTPATEFTIVPGETPRGAYAVIDETVRMLVNAQRKETDRREKRRPTEADAARAKQVSAGAELAESLAESLGGGK